jgi:hypothetical protein
MNVNPYKSHKDFKISEIDIFKSTLNTSTAYINNKSNYRS